MDKCLSHDGAELALQELERYLDNAGQNQLTDLSTIGKEYEAVLNQQFRVSRAAETISRGSFGCFSLRRYELTSTLPCSLPVRQDQVEKVLQKQMSMQEMFDKRRVSLKKLAAKQTRPVQPVAPRPEAFIKSPLSSPGQSPHTCTPEAPVHMTHRDLERNQS